LRICKYCNTKIQDVDDNIIYDNKIVKIIECPYCLKQISIIKNKNDIDYIKRQKELENKINNNTKWWYNK